MPTRYDRQIKVSSISDEGQERIASAKILCVGAGGLGSPALFYLAAAGVGTIDIIDADRISETNLHRQILFTERDVGEFKSLAAQRRLARLNSKIQINAINEYFTQKNAQKLAPSYNLIVDGSDNFQTKLLINDVCFETGIPWVYGGVNQLEGQTAIFWRDHGACYRCLFPDPSRANVKNCEEAGVLGSVVGTIGSCQATLALQHIVSPSSLNYGTLEVFDFVGSWRRAQAKIQLRDDCQTCGSMGKCCWPNQISLAATNTLRCVNNS